MTGAFAGERAVVIGYGISGRAAAAALLDHGAEVLVSEAKSLAELISEGEGTDPSDAGGVEVRTGGHRPEDLDGATLVVVSPGVPEAAPVIEWARDRRLPVWSELEVGARLCRVPYVAVTGTNGKTTTVELLASMMRAGGMDAAACGNVGFPFSAAVGGDFDALAVEASSFQLRFSERLHPRVSVLLNLAPDHLDWHPSFEAYAEAKAHVYACQGPGDVHVGNRDDAEAAKRSREAPCEVHWFGSGRPAGAGAGVVDGRVVARTGAGDVDMGLPADGDSPALLLDAAAATAAGIAFGLPASAVRSTLAEFSRLPHRGGLVAEVGSVKFLDDSKATNPHAVLAALEGLSDVVLIAGGLAKGVDLSPLAAGASSISSVVAIGEAAPGVVAAFQGLRPVRRAGSIEEAVRVAFAQAVPRGTVLLAPACASQDMFRDYRERGDRFAAAARMLVGTPGDASRGSEDSRMGQGGADA